MEWNELRLDMKVLYKPEGNRPATVVFVGDRPCALVQFDDGKRKPCLAEELVPAPK